MLVFLQFTHGPGGLAHAFDHALGQVSAPPLVKPAAGLLGQTAPHVVGAVTRRTAAPNEGATGVDEHERDVAIDQA